MPTIATWLRDELEARAHRLKDAFGLPASVDLVSAPLAGLEMSDDVATHLARFNIEWHVVPAVSVVRFDDDYVARMYPRRSAVFDEALYETTSVRQALELAHQTVQGTIVGVETTQKPIYLPGNTQFYGTRYGHDPTCDPFRIYIEKAGLKSGPRFINSRFANTPATLRSLGEVVNADWHARGLIPRGYQLTVCPPTAFNLVGGLFHHEWSETPAVELSAFRDERGNRFGLVVGSNGPGDFSYVRRLDADPDLRFVGFRVALVPADKPPVR
jgi:hypothetical protein